MDRHFGVSINTVDIDNSWFTDSGGGLLLTNLLQSGFASILVCLNPRVPQSLRYCYPNSIYDGCNNEKINC